MAREAGVSHKHLIALFERNFGIGPKPYARVVRFNALVAYLNRHPEAEWADVVYRFGYYDHAHFARELRRFTGVSPTEFLRSRGPDGDTVVVEG
jgi:AraC-like DNA-binding protein